MQRTTLSVSSTAEIMITETWLAARRRLQALEDTDAVEPGHDDVEEHDIDLLVGEQCERLGAVGRSAHLATILLRAGDGAASG